MQRKFLILMAPIIASVLFAGCGSGSSGSQFELGPNGEVKGTVVIDAGTCSNTGELSGSHFRMIEPGGTAEKGPYISNYDSLCSDKTYTLLSPGSVGLRLGEFQDAPDPAFDEATNGLAGEMFKPTRFYSVDFGFSTESKHPYEKETLSPPQFFVELNSDRSNLTTAKLTGRINSIFISWNSEFLEQGSPHPEGFKGATKLPVGTINLETGRFDLEWLSQVDEGNFDGFVGDWHITGILKPN